jgi:glycosyltransferase involved in cell wall biosynthesis
MTCFDIIIPTWNNLEYLKLAVNSIKKYSKYEHSIYVHVNEGIDGTIDFLIKNNIKYTYFSKNRGVCEGTNLAAKLGRNKYVVYFNDDMVALPEWDLELENKINEINCDKFILCCTPIEPKGTNPNCIIRDYGQNVETFNEEKIITDILEMKKMKSDLVSTWSPMLIPRNLWELIGGFSIEYEPGFGSDPDICKKMYDLGCRNFIGVGKSIIYHFQTKSTDRVIQNNSRDIFMKKYKISQEDFIYSVLKRGTLIDIKK